jgi:tripartite-type tricarboxylate transporter receptor subunit TctC
MTYALLVCYMPSRRQFIKGTGGTAAAGSLLLAGCSGGGGGGGGDGGNGDGGNGGGGGGSDGGGSDDTATPADDSGSDFPQDTIRMIVPYGTGGGYDFYTRLVAKHMEEKYIDTEVRVENIEGSDGRLAINELIDSDAHNVQLMNLQAHVLQGIFQDVNFDLQELTYYPQIAQNVPAIAVRSDSDFETFDDIVAGIENQNIRIASQGLSNTQTLIPYFLGEIGGLYDPELVRDLLVMFDDRGQQMAAVNSGDIDMMSGSFSSILAFDDSLDMILAFTTEDSGPEAKPEMATLATEGVSNASQLVNMLSPRRVFGGPPGVADAERQVIEEALTNTIQDEDLQSEAADAERPINYISGTEMSSIVQDSVSTWNQYQDTLLDLSNSG